MHKSCSRLTVILAVALVTVSCTVGPDYEPPVIDVPDLWRERAVAGIERGEAVVQTWWDHLDDPQLVGLLERAEGANLDLRQAVARIAEKFGGPPEFKALPDVGGDTETETGP